MRTWELQNNIIGSICFRSQGCPSYISSLEILAMFSHIHILSILKLCLGAAQENVTYKTAVLYLLNPSPFLLSKYIHIIQSLWGVSKITWLTIPNWILGFSPHRYWMRTIWNSRLNNFKIEYTLNLWCYFYSLS